MRRRQEKRREERITFSTDALVKIVPTDNRRMETDTQQVDGVILVCDGKCDIVPGRSGRSTTLAHQLGTVHAPINGRPHG